MLSKLEEELFTAVKENNLEKVKKFLQEKPKLLYAINQKDETPLHIAAENGHTRIIQLFLEKLINVNAVDKRGRTPLYLAVLYQHTETIKCLLTEPEILVDHAPYKFTPLHSASLKGNTEIVESLLEKGADVHAITPTGRTALHQAAINGHKDIVSLLLNRGTNPNTVDKKGHTPLYSALSTNQIDVAKRLIKNGASINIINTITYDNGRTLLHSATYFGRKETVACLLEYGADINLVDPEGNTALHLAAEKGHKEIVKLLIESDLMVQYNSTNKENFTPLDLAIWSNKNNKRIVVLLFLANLGYAGIESLLKESWNINSVLNCPILGIFGYIKHQGIPSNWITFNSQQEIIELILENWDALPSHKLPDYWFACSGKKEIIRLLLENWDELNIVDENGNKLLDRSNSLEGREKIVEWLLQKTDVKTIDNLLHWAVEKNYINIVKQLIANQIDVNAVDEDGDTPLYIALHGSNDIKEMVVLLLESGASIYAINHNGYSPLSWVNKSILSFSYKKDIIPLFEEQKEKDLIPHLSNRGVKTTEIKTILQKVKEKDTLISLAYDALLFKPAKHSSIVTTPTSEPKENISIVHSSP